MRSESRFKGIRLIMLTVICFAALLASVLLGVFLTRPAPTTASAEVSDLSQITSVTASFNGTATENTTYQLLKRMVTVTASDSDGATLGELSPDQFELVGDFGSGGETSRFKVIVNNDAETTSDSFAINGFTVESGAVRSISAEYNGSADVYIYSQASTLASYISVSATNWNGVTSSLSQGAFGVEGSLAPTTFPVEDTYGADVTVRYLSAGASTNITTTCEITDIKMTQPTGLSYSDLKSVTALEKYSTADFTVSAAYFENGQIFSVVLLPNTYNVEYMDKDENGEWQVDEDAAGYIYPSDGGSGRVKVTSLIWSTLSIEIEIQVNRIPVKPAYFDPVYSNYSYTPPESATDSPEGDSQKIDLFGYNNQIMEITKVEYNGQIEHEEDSGLPSFDSTTGEINVMNAGTYTVTVKLKDTAQAYYFENDEKDTSLREITLKYTVNPAPLDDLEVKFHNEEGEPVTQWDKDDPIDVVLTGNYGGGNVTYTYTNTTTNATSTTLPNDVGSYTLTVSVEASGNFAAKTLSNISFTIGEREIGALSAKALTYNGSEQNPSIIYAVAGTDTYPGDSAYLNYTIKNSDNETVNSVKDAGEYTLEFSIKEEYRFQVIWADGVDSDGDGIVKVQFAVNKLEIAKPTLNTISSNYTGSAREFSFSSYNATATASSGSFTAINANVSYSGENTSVGSVTVSEDGKFSLTYAGTYKITLSLNDAANLEWKDGDSTDQLTYTFTMNKAGVDVPDAGSKTYTGGTLVSDLTNVSSAGGYIVTTNEGGIDVGPYDVELTLTNPANYKWNGKEGATIAGAKVTIKFEITQATNEWEKEFDISALNGWTYGDIAPSPTAKAKFGTVSFEYAAAGSDNYSTVVPTAAGDYKVRAVVNGTVNYTDLTSDAKEFSIARRTVSVTIFTDNDVTYTYDSTSKAVVWNYDTGSLELVENDGTKIIITYTGTPNGSAGTSYNSTDAPTNAGIYTATASIFGDASGNYTLKASSLSFTIDRATLTVNWTKTSDVYDGAAFEPTYTLSGWCDDDETTGGYTFTRAYSGALTGGKAVNAGNYSVTLSISGGAGNYTLNKATASFTIEREPIARPTADTDDFTYNGTAQIYTPAGFDPEKMTILGNEQTNANEAGYTVTVAPDSNHKWQDGDDDETIKFKFIISRATLDVTWTKTSDVYDGAAFEPTYTLSGWKGNDEPDDYTFTRAYSGALTDNKAVNAGNYSVTLSISGGAGNYVLNNATASFTIKKAQVDVSKIVSEPEGQQGTNPNDRQIEYSSTGTNKLEITLGEYENMVTGGDIVYNSDGTQVTELGVGNNYYVVLSLGDYSSNYEWLATGYDTIINDGKDIKVVYSITQNQYKITLTLSQTEWTYGENETITLLISDHESEGAKSYSYYTSEDDAIYNRNDLPEMPKNAGIYWVRGVVAASGNYAQAMSDPVEFTITARELTVTIMVSDGIYGSWTEAKIGDIVNNPGSGYEQADSDDFALVYTVDGLVSGIPHDAGNYSVKAEWATDANANGNFSFKVTYSDGGDGNFTISPRPVEISWGEKQHTYDATNWHPTATISNLVAGDTYNLKITGAAKDVGDNYTAEVTDLGNNNYTLDDGTDLSTSFKITPFEIEIYIADTSHTYGDFRGYNVSDISFTEGKRLFDGDNANFTFSYSGTLNGNRTYQSGGKFEAGEYTVTVTLGNDNYTFAGGSDTWTKSGITIEKATISSVAWEAHSYSYKNEDQYNEDTAYATATGVYDDGTLYLAEGIQFKSDDGTLSDAEFINAGTYVFTASLMTVQGYNNNYQFAEGIDLTHEYTITPAQISIKIIKQTVTYNGKEYMAASVFAPVLGKTYTVTDSTFGVSLDDSLKFSFDRTARDADSYNVTGTLSNTNFTVTEWINGADAFVIQPKRITPGFITNGGTYGAIDEDVANQTAGKAWYVGTDDLGEGDSISGLGGSLTYGGIGNDGSTWNGASSSAGSYTITLTITDTNYTFASDGSSILTYTNAVNLTVGKHVINSVSWNTSHADSDLTYTGSDLTTDKTFATATGVNDDGTLYLAEGIQFKSDDGTLSDAEFINAGTYVFTASLTTEQGYSYNYQFAEGIDLTHEYTILPAEITSVTASGYNDCYDAAEHEALMSGYTATTVNNQALTWQFISISGTEAGSTPAADDSRWGSMPEYKNAGDWVVWYKITAPNHKEYIGNVTVSISKLDITIELTGSVTYGEAISSNFFDYDPSVTSGGYAPDEEFSNLGIDINSVTSNYKQGDSVNGTYTLTWSYSGTSTNYDITAAATGKLTVNKREISVVINDYNDGVYGKAPTSDQLTWDYASDSLGVYNNETVFELATTATGSSPVTTETRHYYIYATNVNTTNYIIKFIGSMSYDNADNEASNKAAGEYVVKPATARISITTNGGVYDGTARKATAEVTTTGISLELGAPVYYETTDGERVKIDSAPVNVGSYVVVFSSTDENFTLADAEANFNITVKALYIEIDSYSNRKYDGKNHEASVNFRDYAEPDSAAFTNGDAYTVTYSGRNDTSYADSETAPVNVGEYTVTVTLNDSGYYSRNYTISGISSGSNTKEFEITPREILIPINNATVIYGNALPKLSVDKDADTIGFADGEDYDDLGITKINYATALDGNGVPYEPGADAYSVFTITAEAEYTNGNYTVKFTSATLTVTPRAITVTINDQSLTYTGKTAVLGQNEYTISDNGGVFGNDNLGITLSSEGVNVGSYAITASASGTDAHNYSITYSGSWVGEDENKETAGTLTIDKKDLTVTVIDTSVTYGDSLKSIDFDVEYSDFVGHDNESDITGYDAIEYSTKLSSGTGASGKEYAAGDPAGNKYTVSVTEGSLSSNNYNIILESGTLSVVRRVVTAQVGKSAVYNYGAPVAAVVTFDNDYNEELSSASDASYKVEYRGTANDGSYLGASADAWVNDAPMNAGTYEVRLTILSGNYTFGEDIAVQAGYDYIIEKKILDADWREGTIQYVAGASEYTNELYVTGLSGNAQFDEEILSLGNVTVLGSGSGEVSVQPSSENNYTVTVTGVRTYLVTVTINGSYYSNYEFAEGQSTTISFEVSASVNTITVIEGANFDWVYGNAPEWTYDSSKLGEYFKLSIGDESGIIISYAAAEDGVEPENLSYRNSVSDAGSYYLRAYYPGSTTVGRTNFIYVKFTISKASLTAPTLAAGETTYDGSEQSNKVVGFDAALMGITTSVAVTASGNDITLYATNKGGYTVTISLKQPENYVWNTTDGGSDPITLTWTINKATDNSVTFESYAVSWTYGESQSGFTASSTYGTPVVRYAAYSDGDAPSGELTEEQIRELSALSWSSSLPVNAGRYLAVAYVRDTNENYNDAYAFMIFNVNRADLTVSVTGYSGTYDGASHNAASSSLVTGANGVVIASPAWTYSLTSDGEYTSGMPQFKDVADSGSYTVYYKVTAGNNYNEASGSFTVTIEKKDLTLRVENAEITYGEAAPSVFGLASAGWVPGEGITDTKDLTPTITGADGKAYAEGSPVGSYTVALEAGDIAGIYEGSRNYDITLVHGTLTVTTKSVTVELTGTSVWTYGDDITGLTASLNGVISDEVTATVTYSGESYNGVEHSGATVPTEAGIYTVSVTLSGDKAGNYVLSGDTAAEFIINRLAIDIPDAGSKAYTDEPLQSDLSDERYTVKQGDDWIIVNNYIVTLEMTDLNYMWKGADGNTVSVKFSITPAVNSVTAPTIYSWTYGESPSAPTGSVADFGSVHYEYAGEDGEYSLQIPSEAGKYTVIAVVMSDRNWGGAKSSPVEFEIYKAEYAEPTFDLTGWTYDTDKNAYYAVYNGSEQHPTVNAEVGIDGIAAEVTYSKGVTNVSDGVISFTASFNTTSGNYDAPDDISVRIYLTAKPVDVVWTTEYVYNGSVQTPEAYYVGIDGSTVALNVAVDEFRNAGDYSASVMSPNANYVFTNGSETLKITPAPLTVTINDASSVYGEELSALTAEFAPLGTDTKEDIAKLFTLNVSAAEGDYNGAYLTAGRYDIVGGITETVTSNYNIVFENGVYTVTARPVIVAVADQLSDYDGTEPTIDQAQYAVGEGLLPGDSLGITLVKAEGADAGSYVISCEWTNANYDVTYVPGVYKINPLPITAKITNTSWNYGDAENIGATAILDGVISGDTDSVTCVYTYTGTSADGSVTYDGTTIPVKAGSYIVTVTLSGEKAGNYSLTASAIVTVGKMTIAVPESAGEKVYNGSLQLSGYVPAVGAGYTVTSDEGGTDVGTYDVVLTLIDSYNTAWEGSAESSVTIGFNITIADNTVTLTAAPGWTYGGEPAIPTASATFGGEGIYFLYSDSEGGEYTSVVPTAAGDYYVKAAVNGTDNWRYAESAPLKFTIAALSDNTVTVTIADWTYYGTPSVPEAEAAYGEVKYEYAAYDGTEPTEWSSEVPAAAGTYMIRAYVEATEDYNGCEATYTFEILPAALPAPVLNAYYGVYDGASHAALASYSAEGVDGCEVTWQFALTAGEWQDEMPTFENAGSYTVWYSLSAANHEDRTGSFTVVITKRALVVRVGSETINFGESAPVSFDLSYSGFVDGDSAADSVSGTPVFSHNYTEGSGAGTYTVTVSGLQSVNYDITYINGTLNVVSASVVVTIYDQWSVYGDDIALDQSAYGVSGLVEGETLDVVLTKADGTDAGTYAISGRAVSGNYDVTFIAGVYTIYPREVSVKITDEGGGVYGGKISPATARLDGALGQDDVRLNFTYSGVAYDGTVYNGDKVPEKAGVYTVTVTINENNYVMSGVCTSAFVVERRIVDLPDAGAKTYTGSALKSDLASTEDYTVTQGSGWIDAGSYEVTLTLTDSDNCRFNGGESVETVIFRITPAPNSVTAPTIEGWTYGDEPNAPYGSEALFGTPVYVYSESENGEFTSAVPTHAGVYYVKAAVSGSGNYAAAESEAVSFEVARRAVALPGLETSSSVYSGDEQSNAITGYDASVMALSSASSLVTDGSSAALKAAAAGKYTVTVTLTSSDYVWADGSDKVTLTWTIARLAVERPTAAGGEYIYEGEPIEYIPEGFDEAVMNIAGNVAEEAGEYTVTVTLKDAANYVWSDGTTDEVTFTFTVEERLSLLWLIILLACVVAAEVVMLIVGIVRSKKDGGDQGGDDPGASPTPGGAAHSAMLLCPALTAAVIPAQIAAVCILGGAFVVLLAAILVVFLKKKHKNGAPDPGDESGDGADNKPPLGEGADAAGEAAVSDAETESASDASPEK